MYGTPRVDLSPQRHPGVCKGCGAASTSGRDWFLDTDTDETEMGPTYAIMFCNHCFEEMAAVAGFQKFELIRDLNQERIAELEGELNELRSVRDLCVSLGIDIHRASTLMLALSSSELDSTGDDGPIPDRARVSIGNNAGREDGTPESSDDENVGEFHPGQLSLSDITI